MAFSASPALGLLVPALLLAGWWSAVPSLAAFDVPVDVPSSVPGYTLEQVHAVFRHGNRTPEYPYPNDPNANDTWYPTGWDQLSKAGIESSFRLGQAFRRRYDAFLGDIYFQEDVNATSTDAPRAKLTLESVMAGMFPAKAVERWNSAGSTVGTLWQPFVYHYMPKPLDDFLYMNGVSCPRYDQELAQVLKGKQVRAILDEDPEMLDTIKEKGGQDVSLLSSISRFYCTVSIEKFEGRIVPDWVLPFWPERLEKVALWHFHVRVLTRSLQRLKAGPLVKHIDTTLRRASEGTATRPRVWLYSAHDDNVSHLGMALRSWSKTVYPDFNAMLVVELLRKKATGEYAVQVLLRENHNVDFHPVTMEGCTSPCPLDNFHKLVEDVIPDDWRQECKTEASAGSATRFSGMGTLSLLLVPTVLLRSLSHGFDLNGVSRF